MRNFKIPRSKGKHEECWDRRTKMEKNSPHKLQRLYMHEEKPMCSLNLKKKLVSVGHTDLMKCKLKDLEIEVEISYLLIRYHRSFQSWNGFFRIVYNCFFPAIDVLHFDSSAMKYRMQHYNKTDMDVWNVNRIFQG